MLACADADRYVNILIIVVKVKGFYSFSEAFKRDFCLIDVGFGEDYDKFFTAVSENCIGFSKGLERGISDLFQDKISALMPVGVVYIFETVYVKHNKGEVVFVALCSKKFFFKRAFKIPAVGKSCQFIRHREVFGSCVDVVYLFKDF